MFALLGHSAAAQDAPCAERVAPADFAAVVSEATVDFAALELEGFAASRERARAMLACVDAPLAPLELVEFHQLEALAAFVAHDDQAMGASLASVRALAPAWNLPVSVAPRGHPLRTRFEAPTDPELTATRPLGVPRDARVYVDGQPVLDLPVRRQAVVQLVQLAGGVAWTALVPPGGAPPDYPTAPDDLRDRYLADLSVIRVSDRRPVELVVASGVAALASGVTWGLAGATRRQFFDPSTPEGDLPGLRARTNGLQTGAIVGLGAAAGLGAVAVVTW